MYFPPTTLFKNLIPKPFKTVLHCNNFNLSSSCSTISFWWSWGITHQSSWPYAGSLIRTCSHCRAGMCALGPGYTSHLTSWESLEHPSQHCGQISCKTCTTPLQSQWQHSWWVNTGCEFFLFVSLVYSLTVFKIKWSRKIVSLFFHCRLIFGLVLRPVLCPQFSGREVFIALILTLFSSVT